MEKINLELEKKPSSPHFRRTLLAGLFTLIPLWITWFVLELVFSTLSDTGSPSVRAASRALRESWPVFSRWLLLPWVQNFIAALLTIVAIYLLGLLATFVVGRRMIRMVEDLINRIPFVHMVYGSTKKLIQSLQKNPDQLQRVVLIEFPSSKMKTIGFVTASLKDSDTGEELAAVYVPTTPNPTSGYLEIVPASRLVPTTLSVEEAMSFIISGGTSAPEEMRFNNPEQS